MVEGSALEALYVVPNRGSNLGGGVRRRIAACASFEAFLGGIGEGTDTCLEAAQLGLRYRSITELQCGQCVNTRQMCLAMAWSEFISTHIELRGVWR